MDISPEEPSSRTSARRGNYAYIDTYTSALKTWDIEVSQFDPGLFNCQQLLLNTGEVQYRFFHHNLRTMNRGYNTGKGFQFCIPLTDQLVHYLDYWVDRPAICCIPAGRKINNITPKGHEGVSLFLSSERYHHLLKQHLKSSISRPPYLNGSSIFYCSPTQLQGLREPLLIIRQRFTDLDIIDSQLEQWLLDLTEYTIVPRLLQIMESDDNEIAPPKPERFQKALRFILDNLDSPPNINELSSNLGISQRNLQYLFKTHTGVSPKKFIKLCRLNSARQRLWHATYERGKISDIANQLGYWHMGSFAQDFKRLFLKNPSDFLMADPIEAEN